MTPVVHFIRLLEASLASDEHQCDHLGRVYRLDMHHRGGGLPQTYQGVYVPAELAPFLNSDHVVCLNLVEVPSNSVGMLALGPSAFQVLIGVGMSDGTAFTAVPQAWTSAKQRRQIAACAAGVICTVSICFGASFFATVAAVLAGIGAFEFRRQANELTVQPFRASVCYGDPPGFLRANSIRPVHLKHRNSAGAVDADDERSTACTASLCAARTHTGEG